MTPSSKAKVLTDAELEAFRRDYAEGTIHHSRAIFGGLLATIAALKAERDERITPEQFNRHQDGVYELIADRDAPKAELALKDKVVEAARKVRDDLRRGQPRTAALRLDEALNDLDKVMAR